MPPKGLKKKRKPKRRKTKTKKTPQFVQAATATTTNQRKAIANTRTDRFIDRKNRQVD